jgi:GxxExxY protein
MKVGSQRTSRELPPRGEEKPFQTTAERVIAGTQEVHSSLGPGLLETVYEEALAHEFQLQGLRFLRPKEAKLSYQGKGMKIGWHRFDFLAEDEVVGELKLVEKIHGIHEAQLMACLRSLDQRAGLPVNMNGVRLSEGIKKMVL